MRRSGIGGFGGMCLIALGVLIPSESRAGGDVCPGSHVAVEAPSPQVRAQVCRASDRARDLFARCALPSYPVPVRIAVIPEMEPGCVGVFHCDENRIEVLAPDVMEQRRNAQGAFGGITAEAYFASIVVHELAHAMSQDMPCPASGCRAASEYMSYALQIMSLPPEDRAAFERRSGIARVITQEEVNLPTLLLAPDLFAQRVWAHLQQQPDACAFLGNILDGGVPLSRDMP